MSKFQEIRELYPNWDAAFPKDWPKPSMEEIERIQHKFSVKYSKEFIEFQINESHKTPMGDFAFDNFGWANPELNPMENLAGIVEDAQSIGVPSDYAPFKCDNGDYYCIDRTGRVTIWDHNGNGVENEPGYMWPSFCEWLASGFDDE